MLSQTSDLGKKTPPADFTTNSEELLRTLNLSDNFFQVIQATIVDGIVLSNKEGKIVYLNRAAQEMLGASPQVLGLTREELINNQNRYLSVTLEYQYDPFESFNRCLKGDLLTGLTLIVHGEATKILDTSYSPLYDRESNIVGVIADFRDVTILREQQEQIKHQLGISQNRRRRWDALFTSVEEGICVMDKAGKIVEFNPSLELMSGYLESEVIGKKYYEVFKCHDQKGNMIEDTLLKRALITGEAVPYDEHLHTIRDGEEVWVGATMAPLLNEKGEMECLLVVRDINNYKQVEKLKSDFVSIASHELRTPLTVVNGYLSLLTSGDLGKLSDAHKNPQQEGILKKVYLETKRLSSLVEDLLNISRIEEGRLRVDLEPIDLAKLAQETVAEYNLLAESKNLNMEFVGGEKPMVVLGDSNRLKQVFTNLIDNALKYTEKGKVVVKVTKEVGEVVVSVTDTGPGIPPKLQGIIFEKFQQAPGSYLKENNGTGLGLFIVKGIVELHLGKVWLESKAGVGTTFFFSLPSE